MATTCQSTLGTELVNYHTKAVVDLTVVVQCAHTIGQNQNVVTCCPKESNVPHMTSRPGVRT